MDAREIKVHTIEDIEKLPDGERAELINGGIYYMAALVQGIRGSAENCIRKLLIILI